jgi:Ca2+-transporting ATPase
LIWRDPAFLPLLPLQILWINLVTDSLPALALTTLPGEKDLMKRKLDKTGILKGIRGFILVAGIISLIIGLIVFINYIEDITKARTLVTTGAILFEMMLVFNAKSRKSAFRNLWNKYIFGAVAISIILHLIVMYTSLNRFFYFSRLNFYEWGLLIGLCFMGFLIIELYKYAHDKILKYS